MKAEELMSLTEKVRYQDPWELLATVRKAAAEHNMSSDDLARQVAHLAIELGYVQPIRMVDHIDLYEGLDA